MSDEPLPVIPPSRLARFWDSDLCYSFRSSPVTVVASVMALLLVLAAIFAPLIAPYDPLQTSWSRIRKPPSWAHWMGTDENGRDVLSRVIWGARASMMAGVVSVMGALILGVPLGLLAGLAGGWVDAVISRIADAMLSVPFLILAIALAAFLGPALENAMLAIAITASPVFVRLSRGMALEAKSTDWIEAARASLGDDMINTRAAATIDPAAKRATASPAAVCEVAISPSPATMPRARNRL